MLGIFGNRAPFLRRAGSPRAVARCDLTVEASRCGISENAFGPLTLAAVRLSGAEVLSGGILFSQ